MTELDLSNTCTINSHLDMHTPDPPTPPPPHLPTAHTHRPPCLPHPPRRPRRFCSASSGAAAGQTAAFPRFVRRCALRPPPPLRKAGPPCPTCRRRRLYHDRGPGRR